MGRLPNALPILRSGLAPGGESIHVEPELTHAAELCDSRGRLNAAAVGWSRTPLVRANLAGHWPRKKRWNFWNWIAPDFVLSATLADVDYAAFCEIAFTDFESGRTITARAPAMPGRLALPQDVERTIAFRGRRIAYDNIHCGDRLAVAVRATANGIPICADFTVAKPAGHETLNIVVPWTETRFQLNSKHNTLPTTGRVSVGGRAYEMRPEECHAVHDFGRGLWPYRSFWNWGVATGLQDGVLIGVNVGGKWTTGTGITENGLCIDGRLHKIGEELSWDYDPSDWMRPWRVTAPRSQTIDLTLEPIVARSSRLVLGILRTGGTCCFGRWHGTVRAGGRELRIRSLPGWAEEFDHRW